MCGGVRSGRDLKGGPAEYAATDLACVALEPK